MTMSHQELSMLAADQERVVQERALAVREAKAAAQPFEAYLASLLAAKATLAELLLSQIASIEETNDAEKGRLMAKRAALLPKGKNEKKTEKMEKKAQVGSGSVPAAPELNPLPWPETEALPLALIDVCMPYIALLSAPSGLASAAEVAASRETVETLLHAATVTAAVKLDGTNVGKEAVSGTSLVGRRLRIDGATYQRTSVAVLDGLDATRLQRALLAGVPDGVRDRATGMTAYGELVCNEELYDYKKSGLSLGAWRAFGLVLSVADGAARDVTRLLVADGWAATTSAAPGCPAVRLAACPKLLALFEREGVLAVPTVEVGSAGGLSALVANWAGYMREQRGEGLVVTLQRPGDAAPSVHKWKISAEHQPRCVDGLRDLRDKIALLDPATLPTRLAATVEAMLDVATAPLSASFVATTGAALANKYLKHGPSAVAQSAQTTAHAATAARDDAAAAVDAALGSALTKYDALAAMFTAGSTPATLVALLLDEMREDLTTELDQSLGSMAAARVKRYVGEQYAKWKKADRLNGRAERSQATGSY
jgi:hypothetical protein